MNFLTNEKAQKTIIAVLFAIVGWYTRQIYADFKELEKQVIAIRERVSMLETDSHWLQNGQGRLWKKLTDKEP